MADFTRVTVVCSKCKRTVSEGLTRVVDVERNRKVRVCSGIMKASCARTIAEKDGPAPEPGPPMPAK